MNFVLPIIILLLIIFLAVVNKRYENFLTDDIIDIVSNYKSCLLIPTIKNNYKNNSCSILSEQECAPCSQECKWENNMCSQKNLQNNNLQPYPKNDSSSYPETNLSYPVSNLSEYPENDYIKCSSCSLDERPCGKCNNCGWCISGTIDNQDGNCVKPVNGKRPSNCNIDWVYEGKDYGPSSDIKPVSKCYMGTNKFVSTINYPGYNSYGCDLYNAYKKCTECSKSNKCFGMTAGSEGTGYGCIPCTGSQTKANCLAPPDEGGAGCPGISIYDKTPLDPEINNNIVCRKIPS